MVVEGAKKTQEMIRTLNESDRCDFSFSSGADSELVREAEDCLGSTFPKQYREFLQVLNFGHVENQEVFGVRRPLDEDDNWNTVATTLQQRREFELPRELIAIGEEGED